MALRMHRLLRRAVLYALLTDTVTLAAPQNHKKGAPTQPYTISDNVDLVLLDVSVKDPSGGYVTGLKKENFQISEDGRARQITEFAAVDAPVTVGLVVDNSGSMRMKRPEVITAGLAFAKESNPQDQFFVVNFNNFISPGLPDGLAFTDKLQLLHSALYYGQPQGQTALYDAVSEALQHLELSRIEKRTLIVVSDGGDNVSTTKLPELIKLIEASRATIYTIGLFDPENQDLNPGVLRRWANVTGGQFFQPQQLAEVMPIFHQISTDIRNRYSIGYAPDEVNDTRVVRSVKVTAHQDGRKLNVRTRTSYSIHSLSDLVSHAAR